MYAVIGIFGAGETKPSLMSANGKVVLFDTAEIARQVAPLLGAGRVTRWTDADNVFWLPIEVGGVNRAVVLVEYDPYELPPGMPVRSEARGLEWRGHVIWTQVFCDVGQMRLGTDGRWRNAAIEEA